MVHNPLSRLGRRDDGAIAIITVLLTSALFIGLCALVVDTGSARDNRRQAQNAADASALAAGNVLYAGSGGAVNISAGSNLAGGTSAISAAKSFAAINFGVTQADWAACTDASALSIHPDTVCISFDSASQPTTVRVKVPIRNVSTPFAQIWKTTPGSATVPVNASAQALLGTSVTCSLCFLGNVDAGNGDLTVTGGSIAVDGSVTAGPNSYWDAQTIGIVGTWDTSAHPSVPVTTIPTFSDPLASLALPLNIATLPIRSDPCTENAGLHGTGVYGSLSVGNNNTCTLAAGLYVITGTWLLGNHSLLTGTGVTLYVKGPSGYLKFKNGDATFSAPLTAPLNGVPVVNAVPAGYAIIYDRDNSNALELQGNGTTLITGAVYAPSSILDFNGNSCFGFSGGPYVFGGAYTNGNPSCVTVSNAVSATVARTGLHLNQ